MVCVGPYNMGLTGGRVWGRRYLYICVHLEVTDAMKSRHYH